MESSLSRRGVLLGGVAGAAASGAACTTTKASPASEAKTPDALAEIDSAEAHSSTVFAFAKLGALVAGAALQDVLELREEEGAQYPKKQTMRFLLELDLDLVQLDNCCNPKVAVARLLAKDIIERIGTAGWRWDWDDELRLICVDCSRQ
jgi:hypothetical protein